MGQKQPCSRCNERHPPINAQRRRFAELYAATFDAARATEEAKYRSRKLAHAGFKLLARADVQCELKHILSKTTEQLALQASDVLNGLMRIALFDPADILNDNGTIKPLSEIPQVVRRAIAGMKWKDGKLEELKLPDKVRSFELLGKNKRLFTEVFRHEGDINITERIARGRRRAMSQKED